MDVPGVEPRQRWVPRECGVDNIQLSTNSLSSGAQSQSNQLCHTYDKYDSYMLSASWQPGFCEHFPYKEKKPECDALNSGKLDIQHLTLHGLWPNREECGTSYGNCKAPDGSFRPFQLKEETISRISPWMPNFYYENTFGNHEWEKHGACQTLDPDAYFEIATRAVRQIDSGEIGKQVREKIGQRMSVEDFFLRIKQAYGAAVVNNVQLVCSKGSFLEEIRVRLPRSFVVDESIDKLIAGKGFNARTDGCGSQVYVERSGPN